MGKWGKVKVIYISLFCRILFGGICCWDLKNVVILEYGLKLGFEEGSELVSSDNSFKDNIDDNFEGKGTVSGIKEGNR